MSKTKYYVVWQGLKPGIYKSWKDCELQIKGYQGARYKSFPTMEEAKYAFENGNIAYKLHKDSSTKPILPSNPALIKESIVVDAACSSSTWDMEYRGIQLWDGKEIFHSGPHRDGTNNIGEFLAIVHALALLKKQNSNLPIYSDSATAISWVRKKHANTKVKATANNKPLLELIARAEKWLHEHTFTNKILKWETERWGENPADFGRK
jgi:ribonuclease HI